MAVGGRNEGLATAQGLGAKFGSKNPKISRMIKKRIFYVTNMETP
jgi:hypothetical protein